MKNADKKQEYADRMMELSKIQCQALLLEMLKDGVNIQKFITKEDCGKGGKKNG